MAKSHLKRVAVPKTWNLPRKLYKFIVRPSGYTESALPVAVILKEILGLTETRAEAKKIVNSGAVSVDGSVIKNDRLPAGLMSVISVGDNDYRILLNTRGKLFLKSLSAKESSIKLCKVISKTTLKGNKLQIGFHDGRTMLSDKKDIKLNDTIAFKLPEFTVHSHLKLGKDAKAYLTGGSNVGKVGTVESVSGTLILKIGGKTIEAGKENIFVIGSESEMIDTTG